jgi:hypothetical protein
MRGLGVTMRTPLSVPNSSICHSVPPSVMRTVHRQFTGSP